jgi:VIT1/CCC1 family predicted Fe2+/Mn2+ transporter
VYCSNDQWTSKLHLREKYELLNHRIANSELKSVLHSSFNCSLFECSENHRVSPQEGFSVQIVFNYLIKLVYSFFSFLGGSIVPVVLSFIFNNQVIFFPNTLIICLPSSSFSTSPAYAPCITFQ